MQLPIPEEIRRALGQDGGEVVELFDPHTQARYVVVPIDRNDQASDAAAIRDTYAAQNAVARASGWDDPLMDEYDDYDTHCPRGNTA